MNIADVEAFPLPYTEPNDDGRTRFVCLVKVTTDDGVEGWGEGVTLFEEATYAVAALVTGLREYLVGLPADPVAAGRAMRDRMWWYGNAGLSCFALAAIDTALWDALGRAEGRSLLDLLGGPAHDLLPTVTTSHATMGNLRSMAEVMATWVVEAQSCGIKVGFGKAGEARLGIEHQRDVAFVRELRSALGPGPKILVDIGASVHWTVAESIARTLAFEEHDMYWIEEPLGADNPEGYAALTAATSTLIAYGEREWTVRGIERIVATGTVDVVGIDPGRAEGVTGFMQAAQLIDSAGRQANAHAFAGPISYAASLALSLASPACHQLEVPPFLNELYDVVGLPLRPANGRVSAMSGAGLGFDIDETAVRARCSR